MNTHHASWSSVGPRLLIDDHDPVLENTPEQEAAARAREAEQQAALPYKWAQTIGDVDITLEVPGNIKGKDLIVDIKKETLKVAIKGQDAIIDVRQ